MSIPPAPGPHQPQEPPQAPYFPYAPYRPWTQGYRPYNRPAPVNGLAITSLVLGVLCCLPGLGLVFGLVALWRIRRRGERGTGLAVAGSVLSVIGLALWALMLATGGAADFWQGVRDGAHDGARISPAQGEYVDAPGGAPGGETDTGVPV
ncbi:DUF4190 domain-containing protein [Streptomyces sp. NPDC051133]|uniref:DUF4190 domain-containing protein n=1 Tax=Streptomyces sp. NPDC051133 TaxID=3155521 RepID=UPI00341FC86C